MRLPTILTTVVCAVLVAVNAQQQCPVVSPRPVPPRSDDRHSPTLYKVGAFGIRGREQAYESYNATFQDYLNLFVAPRFEDASLQFQLVPVVNDNQVGYLDYLASGDLDFLFLHTGGHSCMESEIGTRSIATVVSKRTVQGHVHELNQYGGVLFTKNDQAHAGIRTIADVRDRTTACVALEAFGSGHLQFRELLLQDMHYLQDVAQIVFMEKQPNVVNAVLQGRIDVGYVRTDQIERTIDERTGELVDMSQIRVLYANEQDADKPILDANGNVFPFPSSTPLYPEWSFSAYQHVSNDITQMVQEAILQMQQHAAAAPALLECFQQLNCTTLQNPQHILGIASQLNHCHEQCMSLVRQNDSFDGSQQVQTEQHQQLLLSSASSLQRCDTTLHQALAAYYAMDRGNIAGWTPTASYMEIRTMQEDLNFLTPDRKCIRTDELSEAVTCPPGHFPKPKDDMGCESSNLDCYGFACLCRPCVKAYDVDFFPVEAREIDESIATVTQSTVTGSGCSKFEICGFVEQNTKVTYYAIDNRQRKDAKLTMDLLNGEETIRLDMVPAPNRGLYEYQATLDRTDLPVGEHIVLVLVNGEQIPESPFRMQVTPRECADEFGDSLKIATTLGDCVCRPSVSTDVFGRCVTYTVLIPCIVLPVIFLLTVFVLYYVEQKRKAADSIWKVDPNELRFHDPPRVLGRGTFGLVLLAEYRGTQVAVKRVLPPSSQSARSSKTQKFDFNDDDGLASVANLQRSSRRSKNRVSAVNNGALSSATNSAALAAVAMEGGSSELVAANTAHSSSEATHRERHTSTSSSSLSISASSDGSVPESPRPDTAAKPMSISDRSSTVRMSSSASLNKTTRRSFGVLGLSGSYSHKQMQREFIREMRLLSRLRHPCITTTMGAVVDKGHDPMLVMEHMDLGSLYDLLHNDSMLLDGEILLPILRDIARGLRFLHAASPQIVHSDLKAANVLVDGRFHAKVADFGLSRKRYFFHSQANATGTPFWMAPELLRNETANTTMSDVYAFGIVLFEVLTRSDPYEGESAKEVLQLVADTKVRKRPRIPSSISTETEELLRACLRESPGERPTAESISMRLEIMGPDQIVVAINNRRSTATMSSGAQPTSAEDLLTQLFPAHIAKALREGRKVEPEQHDSVTVYFSDIVDYTKISAALSPTKVSSLLDRLYTKFDRLCDLHDVFKVETVGDAYMTVTNIAKKDGFHVERMAAFALDAVDAASSTLIDEDDPSKGYVQIRSGFNTGPVVAHVVGTRNPRYSIIGDTVNTAARMESNSSPGKVQCSEASAAILQKGLADAFDVKQRGVFSIKGKGEMTLFWVGRARGGNDTRSVDDDGSPTDVTSQAYTTKPQSALTPIIESSGELLANGLSSTTQAKGTETDTAVAAAAAAAGASSLQTSPSPSFASSQTLWIHNAEVSYGTS